jgi:predicted PurR-regulated permease PerM
MMGVETTLLDPRKADEEETTTTVPAPVGIRSLSLTLVGIVAAVFALQHGKHFFIPLVISVLVSYALDPVVSWFAKRGVPRSLAAAVVLLALVGTIGAGAYSLRGEAITIVQQLPQAAQRLRDAIRKDRQANRGGTIEQVQKAAAELSQAAKEATATAPPPKGVQRVQIEEPAVKVSDYLWWSSAGLMAFAGQTVSVLFLVYFMLMSGDLFKRKLVQVTGPTLTKKKITVQILDEISEQIERFLLVQAFMAVVVGVASWIAFRWVGLEQAGIWAIVAGVFNSIPYFGPVVVTGGIAIVAFLQFGTIGMAAFVAAIALAITSLEGFLLTPWLTSRASSMNAVAIFVGLLFWSWLWGVWGTLLAVPMLMVLKAVCDRIEDLKPVGELLGD